MNEVIDNKEQAIKDWDDKTGLDDPGEGQFKLGRSEFAFDFGIFFKGKLFGLLIIMRFLCHTSLSIALVQNSCNDNAKKMAFKF